jgi:hypothetical protein
VGFGLKIRLHRVPYELLNVTELNRGTPLASWPLEETTDKDEKEETVEKKLDKNAAAA